jgi:hypothetical protein
MSHEYEIVRCTAHTFATDSSLSMMLPSFIYSTHIAKRARVERAYGSAETEGWEKASEWREVLGTIEGGIIVHAP